MATLPWPGADLPVGIYMTTTFHLDAEQSLTLRGGGLCVSGGAEHRGQHQEAREPRSRSVHFYVLAAAFVRGS